jgi:hypothetical protein
MLIMNSPRDGYEQYNSWAREEIEANVAFMTAFSRKLREAGELVGAEGLSSPHQARRVRAGEGRPVTDGVFPEAKEFLAGYYIIDVDSAARAYEIAAELSTAPGGPIAGADYFWIEVREIMS